jgi:hypothetical protein
MLGPTWRRLFRDRAGFRRWCFTGEAGDQVILNPPANIADGS